MVSMKSKYIKHTILAAACLLAFLSVMDPVLAVNLISNPGFESGTASWTFYNGGGVFSVVSPGFEGDKTAKIDIVSLGTNMQLYQIGIALEPNTKYRLSFSAYSSSGHDLTVYLHKHTSPYTNYGLSYTPDIGTSWQTFTTEFNTTGFTGNVSDARLRFWFVSYAAAGDVYYIDNVLLEKFVASPDTAPPTAISNLAVSNVTYNSAMLAWTAPGDDNNTGTASQYDIRYSTNPINDTNWASAAQASGEPTPLVAGTLQSFNVPGLIPNTTYYFAIKAADEVPNWSGLSNVANASTTEASRIETILTVDTPIFNPPAGNYSSMQLVNISTATTNATIYYTSDGIEPTEASAVFSAPINISSSVMIKAKAFKPGMLESETANASYSISIAPNSTVNNTNLWTHISSKNLSDNLPAPNAGNEQTSSIVLDVDNDGLNDFVIFERTRAPGAVWYKRNSTGWQRYVIDDSILYITASGASYDVDGDGYQEIVGGGDWRSNMIWWWDNPCPNNCSGTWTRYTVKNTGGYEHHDQMFGDFDNDNQTELLSWNQYAKNLYLFEIPDSSVIKTVSSWPYTIIYTWTGDNPEGFAFEDIDGDGNKDIIGGGLWFKYSGGTTFTPKIIESRRVTEAAAGQWKKGGAPEVIFSQAEAPGRLIWFEYDRINDSWTGHDLLGYDLKGAHSLQLADVNADGNLDIFVAEMMLHAGTGAKSLVLYGDGNGGILSQETISTGLDNHESRVSDLDGDGDLDILAKPYDAGAPGLDIWLQNTKKNLLDNWTYQAIDTNRSKYGVSWYSYFGLSSADATGDGCKEIVSGKYFYKNPGCGTSGGAWNRTILPVDADGALFANVDGDANADIIAFGLPDVYWFEAIDNVASSWTLARTITLASFVPTAHKNPQASRIADVNNDGLSEILFEGGDGSSEGLYALAIPSSPLIDAWILTRLTPVGGDGFGIGDIDGDGDLDVTIGRPSNVKWYENPGSLGLWTGYNVGDVVRSADRFEIADVDGDRRPDILISEETYDPANFSQPYGSAYWFKNPADPKNGNWTRNFIGTEKGYAAPQSMGVVDMDNDGDLDVVLGEHQDGKRMFVLENNGAGNFTEHLVGSDRESHGLIVSDIDNDDDYDIVHIGWNDYQSIHFWENKAILNSGTAMPSFSPASGEYPSFQPVAISTSTINATIRYTTDGSDPMESSMIYEGPINVSSSTVIKAKAWKYGLAPSGIASANYTIYTPEVASISVSPLSVTLTVNSTQQFTATAKDQKGRNMDAPIFWSLNDTIAGSIYSSGYFTALADGTVVVTAYSGAVNSTAQVTVVSAVNIISNPGFESGTASWNFWTGGSGSFSVATPAFEGANTAKISLGAANSNIQLYQYNIALEPNTRYRLRFAAYSNTGHNVDVRLQKHVSPYTGYGLSYTADLGTSWQEFSTEFTTSGFYSNVSDGRLMFWLAPYAAAGDIYYIDNVRLEKVPA